MYTTKTELKNEVRNELKCPAEFSRHLSRFDVFGGLKAAALSDDNGFERNIMHDNQDAYFDYCSSAGLEFGSDNQKARVGFFIY